MGSRKMSCPNKKLIDETAILSLKGLSLEEKIKQMERERDSRVQKESIGGFIAVSRYASATYLPPAVLSHGVGWQGIGILLSGLFGTVNGSSVSIENAGLLGLTRIGSRRVVQISAGFMIFFSILGPNCVIQFEVDLISWITVVDVCKNDGIIKKVMEKGEQIGSLPSQFLPKVFEVMKKQEETRLTKLTTKGAEFKAMQAEAETVESA